MTKKELKKLVKTERKKVRENIKLNLVKELKDMVAHLGQGSDVIEKQISKGSKALAKKLSKKFKIDENTLSKTTAAEDKPAAPPAAAKAKKVKAAR